MILFYYRKWCTSNQSFANSANHHSTLLMMAQKVFDFSKNAELLRIYELTYDVTENEMLGGKFKLFLFMFFVNFNFL